MCYGVAVLLDTRCVLKKFTSIKTIDTLLGLSFSLMLSAQDKVQIPDKDQIEAFYAVSEFLDGSSINWLWLQRYDYGKGGRGL